MDTEQLFGFGTLTGSGISSYSSPYPTVSSLPDRLSGTLKFEIGNSPGSPFSTQLDNETVSSVSDSQEKPSSTRSLSGFSPSGNSSAESNSYLNQRNNSLQSISHSSPDMKQALQQLETALMGPDDEDMAEPNDYHGESGKSHAQGEKTSRGWGQEERYDSQPRTTSMSHPRQLLEADATPVEKRHKAMAEESSSQSSQPNNLKQLLIECAKALAENNMTYFDNLVNKARGEVSITGEPIQRLGAYLVEGLVARKQLSGNNIYRALRCREPDSKDLLSYMQILYEICPYLKFGYILPLQLHHTPDESVDVNNPRDGLLRMIKSLNPKVTTLVEQESNTNTTPFLTRFVETLEYYMAIFESIDVTLDRVRKERIGLEQHCLARDMVNVVACEGRERVERHELFGKWKSRFTMAGFKQYPLSSYVNSVIKSLLKCYSEHYTLVERDGAMLLGWKERNLVSASAWY
ncbi:Chitin-inducible gibberellin-responsive protein 1 [Linum perenne]